MRKDDPPSCSVCGNRRFLEKRKEVNGLAPSLRKSRWRTGLKSGRNAIFRRLFGVIKPRWHRQVGATKLTSPLQASQLINNIEQGSSSCINLDTGLVLKNLPRVCHDKVYKPHDRHDYLILNNVESCQLSCHMDDAASVLPCTSLRTLLPLPLIPFSQRAASRSRMKFTELPYTLFLEIVSYLSPKDVILCRSVALAFLEALTQPELNISLILQHFPRSKEGRLLQKRVIESNDIYLEPPSKRWAETYALLARRYHHLGSATPWKMTKIPVYVNHDCLRGVTPWNKFLSLNNKTSPFHYWETAWTFDPGLGILVYPSPRGCYKARDLESDGEVTVPFHWEGKVVRRIRIHDSVLIFDWCEEEPCSHARTELAHKHFTTAFDVTKRSKSRTIKNQTLAESKRGNEAKAWAIGITFKSEWKIHPLGLPLNHQDRFFSTHNKTHYAVYIWRPSRSPWREEGPLENLTVWEFGLPSSYRPSLDPNSLANHLPGTGPRMVWEMGSNELDLWGIRQGETPTLRELAFDDCTMDMATSSSSGHIFVIQEEHRWSSGPHSSFPPPRLHRVKSTGIPLTGTGPAWVDECGYGDGTSLHICWPSSTVRYAKEMKEQEPRIALRELWDPWGTWPGRAPCWRHEDFPYLTVSEVNDGPAGLRISARQCFMLETLSVHARPRLRVEGAEIGRRISIGDEPRSREDSGISSRGEGWLWGEEYSGDDNFDRVRTQGPGGEEIQFGDEMWKELMGKGFICGNERWTVGEDSHENITILEF